MIIIIGLGNPGKKFEGTRHNIGFMAIDEFARKNDFPDFKLQKKSNAIVSERILGNEAVVLAKPQTFMNDSGKAVKQLISNTEAKMADLVIIHDDIDLPVGKIKIVKERGSAGHKGVESIIKNIGNDGLIRFRIGIAGQKDVKAMKVVLKNFSEEEQKIIGEIIHKTTEALNLFINEGLEKTMNEYNSPPHQSGGE
jgi:PTH1 family peptidyl-tRNA hydrolase